MSTSAWAVGVALLAVLSAPCLAIAGPPPSLVFVLLDTTRADRLGAWSGDPTATPALDALARRGARFASHWANAHATRPSMPQLMSGRYYHQSILREFTPTEHPREFPFSREDPTAVLLPALLHDRGYQALAVSAHPWVARESRFGAPFDAFDLLAAPAERGHAGAASVVDRAIGLWRGRDRTRPTFLYVHLMDAHMPRFVPPDAVMPRIPGYDPATRFAPNGEPAFDGIRRRWDRADATDFTADDRRWFRAVYDANLHAMDAQLQRLFDVLLEDDPALGRTLVVVTADHGEELGDDGRTDHTESLADAVQHIPLLIAGPGIPPGQVATRPSQHVDVLPTILARLEQPLPAGVHVDGTALLDAEGRPVPVTRPAVYYAWETYRGIRLRDQVLRMPLTASLRARCDGAARLFAASPDALTPLEDPRRVLHLAAAIDRRLAPLAAAFRATRYGPATRSVLLETEFWRTDGAPTLECSVVGPDTTRPQIDEDGWTWTGRSVAVLHRNDAAPLGVRVDLPDGPYRIDAVVTPVDRPPWVFGFGRWLRNTFLDPPARSVVPLGDAVAAGGWLRVAVPQAAVAHRQILGLRATPAGMAPEDTGAAVGADPALHDRLKALGYVQ